MMVGTSPLVCAAAGDMLKRMVMKNKHEEKKYVVLMRQCLWEEMWKGMKMMR